MINHATADQIFCYATRRRRPKQLPQQVAIAEAVVSVLREGRMIGDRSLQAEAAEPAMGETARSPIVAASSRSQEN